jgi:hypothetical protein
VDALRRALDALAREDAEERAGAEIAHRLRSSVPVRQLVAKNALELGFFQDAIFALHALLQVDECCWEAWYLLAEACAGAGAPDAAADNIERALQLVHRATLSSDPADGADDVEHLRAVADSLQELRTRILDGAWEPAVPPRPEPLLAYGAADEDDPEAEDEEEGDEEEGDDAGGSAAAAAGGGRRH